MKPHFKILVVITIQLLLLLAWCQGAEDIGNGTLNSLPVNSATTVSPPMFLALEVSNNSSNSEQSGKKFQLSPVLLDKAYSYLSNSPAFKEYSKEELSAILRELDTWEPPEYFSKKFAYYHAGYDYDERPIWVSELGKYNMREVVEKGPEALAIFDRYVLQAAFNVLKSIHEQNLRGIEITEAAFLIDYDGLDMYQLTHIPTVTFALRVARIYSEAMAVALGKCVVINANYVGELGINLLRPILGGILERVEVFGTNKARWLPTLRNYFPETSLPSWYGGSTEFKPIKIYGR